jgi:hypothetical protein
MREWTKIISQVSQLKIKSVTDSLFKYGLLGFCVSVIAAVFIEKDWVLVVLFGISGLIILIGLFFYCYFAIVNPDYLRSETYQLRKQATEMLGDNERSANPNIKAVHLITNPQALKDDSNRSNPMLNQ